MWTTFLLHHEDCHLTDLQHEQVRGLCANCVAHLCPYGLYHSFPCICPHPCPHICPRFFSVAANEVMWDYAPSNINQFTGESIFAPDTDAAAYSVDNDMTIGKVYKRDAEERRAEGCTVPM